MVEARAAATDDRTVASTAEMMVDLKVEATAARSAEPKAVNSVDRMAEMMELKRVA